MRCDNCGATDEDVYECQNCMQSHCESCMRAHRCLRVEFDDVRDQLGGDVDDMTDQEIRDEMRYGAIRR